MQDQQNEIIKEYSPLKRSKSLTSPEKPHFTEYTTQEPTNTIKRSSTLIMSNHPSQSQLPSSSPLLLLNDNTNENETMTNRLFSASHDYQESTLERKKEAYDLFKNWEQKRANLLAKHNMYLDRVYNKLELRSLEGIKALEMIVKFFKDRLQQEDIYQKSMEKMLPKFGNFFKELKIDESTQGVFPKLFEEFGEYHTKYIINSRIISEFIKTTVLNDMLDSFKKTYLKKIEDYKSKITDKRKKLTKTNKETQQKFNEYAEFCIKMFKSGINDKSKDFYHHELRFIQIAKNQMKDETELGKEIVAYIDELKKLECQRLDLTKRSLSRYMMKMCDMNKKNISSNGESVIKTLDTLKIDDELENFFCFKTFCDTEEDISYLKSHFPKASQLTLLELKLYLKSFDYKQIEHSPLTMKEWKASRDLGLLKGVKMYNVIATVDYNLILIEDKVDVLAPEKIMKMSQLKLILDERKDMNVVDILEVVPGLIMERKKKISLKFENEDSAQEFIHFMTNYEVIKGPNPEGKPKP